MEDGIVEFKENSLSILTSSIFNIKDINKEVVDSYIVQAEKELSDNNIDDQKKFLLNHKVEVLRSITVN